MLLTKLQPENNSVTNIHFDKKIKLDLKHV